MEQSRSGAVLAADPSLTSTSRAEAARARAAGYDAWFEEAWGRYAFAVEGHALLRALGSLAGVRMVDVGCGSGRFTALFEQRGARVTGVDADPAMLELASLREAGPLVAADAARLPFSDRAFDVALAATLFEFVAQPALALAEMARVTRPGGKLVIGALNVKSPWGVAHRRRLQERPWKGARFLSPAELRRLGGGYGEIRLSWALYAPGGMPGLGVLGPLLEMAGHSHPAWGAFQVLTVDLP